MDNATCQNTDREIWRKTPNDAYSPSIHATQSGNIGINVAGRVIVMPVEKWHALGRLGRALDAVLNQPSIADEALQALREITRACDHAAYRALPEPEDQSCDHTRWWLILQNRPRHCPTCGTCMWDAGD